jgi:hypothetical protein
MMISEREGLESVDLAGEGRASKAVSARDEYAPAGDHAPTETATTEPTATEMHSTAQPTMHATESTTAVDATESTTAALCHGWRCKSNCRSKHGRCEAAEKFAFHDCPPQKKCQAPKRTVSYSTYQGGYSSLTRL